MATAKRVASGSAASYSTMNESLFTNRYSLLARPKDFIMLTKRIIPCFDVDKGRVVKGVSFVELRDAGDPVEMARVYDEAGADELVFLDITASSDDRTTVYDMVERTASQVFIPFTVGGGVRSDQDVRLLLKLGADKVSMNTA